MSIHFNSLSTGDSIICVVNCPNDKISHLLDRQILAHVNVHKNKYFSLDNVSLSLLEKYNVDETAQDDTGNSVIYVEHTSFGETNIDNTITIILIPKENYIEEDIIYIVCKKLLVLLGILLILVLWNMPKIVVNEEL